jgi:hypothetical protein
MKNKANSCKKRKKDTTVFVKSYSLNNGSTVLPKHNRMSEFEQETKKMKNLVGLF